MSLTFILNERDEPVAVGWEDYAAWCVEHKSELMIAMTDIRNRKDKYVTTVRTRFCGIVENLTNPPLVWLIEEVGGGEEWRVATRQDAIRDHRRMVKKIENYYQKH